MDKSDARHSVQPPRSQADKARRGTFYFLQMVVSVAFIVATLFTAWTDIDQLPTSLMKRISQAIPSLLHTPTPQFPTATPLPVPHIGVVVGHWDDKTGDPGAVCGPEKNNLTELEVNLSVATMVQSALLEAGFEVDLLREFDERLNGYKAVALVSIHADSCGYVNNDAKGFKVAASYANPYSEKSARLTACIRDRYAQSTGMNYHSQSITPDMTDYHAFEEINGDTPAAIIEVGFLNLDFDTLTQKRDLIAKGITDGILCYIRNEDIPSTGAP